MGATSSFTLSELYLPPKCTVGQRIKFFSVLLVSREPWFISILLIQKMLQFIMKYFGFTATQWAKFLQKNVKKKSQNVNFFSYWSCNLYFFRSHCNEQKTDIFSNFFTECFCLRLLCFGQSKKRVQQYVIRIWIITNTHTFLTKCITSFLFRFIGQFSKNKTQVILTYNLDFQFSAKVTMK